MLPARPFNADGGEPVTVPGVHVAAIANRLRSLRAAAARRGEADRSTADADENAVVFALPLLLPPLTADAGDGSANEGVATGAGSGGAKRTTIAYR